MKMKIKRLTDTGIAEFREFLSRLRRGENAQIPLHLLSSDMHSEDIEFSQEVETTEFSSRYEIGKLLVETLNGKDLSPYLKDCGFWTWFSLLWFEQICRINKSGAFDPYDDCNYILDGNRWGRRQRHCILTTYQIVSRYGEKGRFLLSKLHNRGEILEQIAGTQENLFSKVVIELAHDLYSSSKPGQYFKTGAAGKKGGASRYVTWLNQIRLTFDPNSMTKDDLKALLPKVEYQRFLK